MKRRFFLGLIVFVSLFAIAGCGKSTNDNSKHTQSSNKIKTKLSCYHETYLFHSKKSVEHIMSLNKENKLIEYEYIERYFEFDETGGDFDLICEASPAEAENNNKMYPYLKETAECNKDSKEVKISDVYDISKLESKNPLKSDELIDSLDDNYKLDIENYKNAIGKKVYICEEK